jgi:integrase
MNQLNVTSQIVDKTVANEISVLEQIGQVANQVAASHVFADYITRKSDYTIQTQAEALNLFGEYLGVVGIPGHSADSLQTDPQAWRGITWGIVEGFVKWCLQQGFAINTVNNRLSAVKVYARLAAKAKAIPAEELQLIRVVSGYGSQEGKRVDERRPVSRVGHKKAAPVRITAAQAKALKSQPNTPQGRRDALLMCLLLDHGLRVGEVVRLEVTDFDLERGELHFYRPKVDMKQTHELTGDTWRAARLYFLYDAPAEGRILLGSLKSGRLTGRSLSIRAIKKRVAYLGRSQLAIGTAGDTDLSPHDCRHYWATDAARNGTDPFRLQEAGGWASLAMPRRYVEAAEVANKGVKLSE